ncbi:MAG: hypothetical protein DME65_11740 [Verrucomicrobia bacterium]|nr:MAG: hypothetical protein DME65_11740 [Verrucomicrobiota bacterium]
MKKHHAPLLSISLAAPFLPSRLTAPFLSATLAMLLLLLSTVSSTFADSANWKMRPATGDWNHAANWTPPTIPNGPAETATFQSSNVTDVLLSADTEVDGIVFGAGASAFTITASPRFALTISGVGITNNSGIPQNFVTGDFGTIAFTNSATAGNLTMFTSNGSPTVRRAAGFTEFFDSSTAGNGTFINNGTAVIRNPGSTRFFDSSTAGNGSFTNHAGGDRRRFFGGGNTIFGSNSTAGNGTFTNRGGAISGVFGGLTAFFRGSTAESGTFINNGGTVSGAGGGRTSFGNTSSAGSGTFINNGGTVSGADGGETIFNDHSTADSATLIANGGAGAGGSIQFFSDSTGGTASVDVRNNDISEHFAAGERVIVGSVEGDGNVFLGGINLTVGSNDLSTLFSGVIRDGGTNHGTGGSLSKTGTGVLILDHRNTYTGGTTINGGKLVVNNKNGSGTGSGPVQVKRGRLGGRGTIAGDVTVGDGSGRGAALSPGNNAVTRGTLTIQGTLTFNPDAAYNFWLNTSDVTADEVIALGITINSDAQFSFSDFGGSALTPGTVFTVISDTAATPIAGTFSNLPDGATFSSNGNTYQVNYEGGDGNDLTMTVVP